MRRILSFLALSLSVGCAKSETTPSLVEPERFYWELRPNFPAVQLSTQAPYNTLQLFAVPYASNGMPLDIEGEGDGIVQSPVWTSSDSSTVKVSASGVITALAEANYVTVHVQQTIGFITRSDSVIVRVKDYAELPELETLSIVPTDSLKRAARNLLPYTFPVTALDKKGNSIPDIPIHWTTSHPNVLVRDGFSDGWFLMSPESVRVFATTWVYGVAKTDSFTLVGGWPILTWFLEGAEIRQVGTVTGEVIFAPILVTSDIGPGGIVPFYNRTGHGPTNLQGLRRREGVTLDIIFDDPSVALASGGWPGDTSGIGGNILGISSDTTLYAAQYRRFVIPGEHSFTVQPLGIRGRVHVHDR